MSRARFIRFAPFLAALIVVGTFAFFDPVPLLAQDAADTLEAVGDETGLGSGDPRIIVASIIRTGLTFVGILAVLICLYAGFTWMTAGGNAEKVERAKKMLVRGGIGLTIILLSWAITTFVITALLNATGAGGGGGGTGGDDDGGPGLGNSPTSTFTVTDYSPDGAVSIRNVQLRVTFSRAVDETTVDGNITITNASTNAEVDGTLEVSNNVVTFTPSAACPTPNEDRYCFDADTTFTVTVSDDIESSTGKQLVCAGDRCTSSFTTGSLVDTEDPVAEVTDPEQGDGVPTDSTQIIQVLATDDSEVGSGTFALDDTTFDSVGAVGDDLSSVTIESTLDTSDLANGTTYRITVEVTDIAGNTDEDSIRIEARPAWCFNGELDSDLGEEGIDCGGDSASDEYCGACSGSSCTDDNECASGSCIDGTCMTLPEIESVSPPSGAVGTYVTISGSGFGTQSGTIAFTSEDGTDVVEADIPSCSEGWSDTEIVVEVPEGAGDGPLVLTTSGGYEEATDDDNGAVLDDFDVDDTVHPKLCDLSPDDGESTDAVTLSGLDFGDSQGESTVQFGESEAGSYTSWGDTSVAVTVPSLADDDYSVVLFVDGVQSNELTFTVEAEASETPVITEIDPSSGAIGQYLTISGINFGASEGTVWFESTESGEVALADTDFPDACDSFWSDDEIVVIVPATFQNDEDVVAGEYTVYVTTQGGTSSSAVDFTIEDGEPDPGLCAIEPDTAQAGEQVTLYGDNFGSTEDTVTFYDGVAATFGGSDAWSDDEIVVTVPSGATTGDVVVTVGDVDSNAVTFAVGDDDDTTAAAVEPASYGWYFSTGAIPETPELLVECSAETVSGVPNARFTDEVCTNAVVYATFSTLMDEGSVNDAVTVATCTADGDSPCSDTEAASGTLTVTSSSSATSFTWVPDGDAFTAATTYQVTVSDTAVSTSDVAIEGDVVWEFTTASTASDCAVSAVYVSPSSSTIDTLEEPDNTEAFQALPVSGCVVTNASSYIWDWTVDNSYADFTTSADGACDGGTTSCATVEALAEGYTDVIAEETDSAIQGVAELTIDFTDPYVNNYAPNCEEACRNATIAAEFNTDMDATTVESPGAVILATCSNELCTTLTDFGSYSVACVSTTDDDTRCDRAEITLTANLTENTYYRVIVSGDVTSDSGVPLTRTNYSGDFSWTFKVKDGEAVCGVDRLSLSPEAATAATTDDRQSFTVYAYGEPDSCSVAGQELSGADYDWSWTDPIPDDGDNDAIEVAQWWDNAEVDTDEDGIAAGCTASCLAGGSASYEAICGDNLVGTGEECEDGNTVDGDGCSSSCLHEGDAATCGDGTLDDAEDCDDSNTDDGDGCSALCLNEGSSSVNAVCGNGDIAYEATVGGEDCDDGNLERGDGCDTQCLLEGAPTLSSIGGAVCGDGEVDEPYENCDTALSSEGCSDACLLEGSSALYSTPSVCGDTSVGIGEECDEGDAVDGDGCSADCLLEGASTAYATPSFCGDGAAGAGEWDVCEAGSGDGNVDPLQLALIGDDAATEVDIDTGEAIASIVVTEPVTGVSTSGTYTLSCTAATDADCPDAEVYGVGTANCCMPRPEVTLFNPSGADACRNALVYAVFTEEMATNSFTTVDDTDGSTVPRMYAVLDVATTDDGVCPSTHTTLAQAPTSWWLRAWMKLRQVVTGAPARATSGDCVLPIVGFEQSENDDGTFTVRMRYSEAMEPNADYTIIVETDPDNTDGDAEGVTSLGGVGIYDTDGSVYGSFTTGSNICTLDELSLEDGDENPYYFSQDGEAHTFTATAISYATGEPQEITPIASVYDWEIAADDWTEDSDGDIVTVAADATATDTATVTAAGQNGEANVLATATITADSVGGTVGEEVVGTANVTAYLCERPWPTDSASFPWADSDMHFSTYYCLDNGADDDTSDDYPELTVVEAEERPVTDDIVLREYLLEVSGDTDAIGVRIVSNEDYLSPENWYLAQGFTGTPHATTVDGFAAVEDGRTTYIAAANDTGAGIYSNIYVVSYSENASQETIDIYHQLLSNLSFATNVADIGLCYDSAGGLLETACDDDADCTGAGEYCGDLKAQLMRDTKRIADATTIALALEAYGEDNGVCSATVDQSCSSNSDCPDGETCEAVVPTLASGTYVRALGASAWTSWSDLFGAVIDLDDSITDPLNSYGGACGTGTTLADYDGATCVNAATGAYVCPDDAHVYHYRATGSQYYTLAVDLEYDDGAWVNSLDDDSADMVTYSVASGSAAASGFTTDFFCESDTVYGTSGVCGDGIVNTHDDGVAETCEVGERGGTATTCDPDDTDDYDGDGDATNDTNGSREQTCNSTCTGWENDTDAECVPAECGNGVVDTLEECDDGDSNGRYGYCGSLCTYDSGSYCGDGELSGSEACDCGAPSLTSAPADARPFGGAAWTCAGVNGTYDEDASLTCSWSCDGPASSCGDEVVDSGEECDGDTDAWEGSLCSDGTTACTSDADCASGDTCGYTGYMSSSSIYACPEGNVCVGGDNDGMLCNGTSWSDAGVSLTEFEEGVLEAYLVDECEDGGGTCDTDGIEYQTYHTRSCDDSFFGNACTWDTWEFCNAGGQSCGDGSVDGDEECDDGNTTNTDECTNACALNVCGDGYLYSGEEQCDEGTDNGQGCDANYESSCTACSTTCRYEVSSGEFCGDGSINGEEFCDAYARQYYYYDSGTDAVYDTCDTLGETVTVASVEYTCRDLGVCNGGDYAGEYCTADTMTDTYGTGTDTAYCGVGSGDCVLPTCASSCASSCPFTYDDTSLLITTNQPGAVSASAVDLYTYDDSSTSELPNAATITVPACDTISSITADISMEAVDPPTTYIVFLTDLSRTMQWEVTDDTSPDTGESSRLAIAQASMESAIAELYSELPGDVYIGALGFKGLVAGDCYVNGDPNTSVGHGAYCEVGTTAGDDECDAVDGVDDDDDYCVDTTSDGASVPYGDLTEFMLASGEDDLVTAVQSYFVDPEWYSSGSGHGTFTKEALEQAESMFDAIGLSPSSDNVRYIAILLSDGEYTSDDPIDVAETWDTQGYELYTATIGDNDSFIEQMNNWSSNNYDGTSTSYTADSEANAQNGIDYSYVGTTEDEIEDVYEQIIDSILGVSVTIISSDDDDTDDDAESDSMVVEEGYGVELPWPTGFACDGTNEQALPVRFTFAGDGQIAVSNVQIEYCAP